jgi:hypothetical protein
MTQAVALAQQASTGVSPGFRNRIINGAMTIAQRTTSAVTTDESFPVDRFQVQIVNANLSLVQSSTAPAGFNFSTAITVTSTTSSGSNDRSSLFQVIEGFNTADLGFGTANAKTITVSFWARSTVAGTYSGNLSNNGGTRTYIFTYTLAANTWTYVTATIAGDTGGTWVGATNGAGLVVRPIMLNCGSNFQGTAGSWIAGDNRGTSGSTYLATSNSGAVFNITGVQLEVGSTATSFEYLDYGRILIQCQRYYQQYNTTGGNTGFMAPGYCDTSSRAFCTFQFPVYMRSAPSLTVVSATAFALYNVPADTVAASSITLTGGASTNDIVSSATITVNSSAVFTAGRGTVLKDASTSSAGRLQFSAEF